MIPNPSCITDSTEGILDPTGFVQHPPPKNKPLFEGKYTRQEILGVCKTKIKTSKEKKFSLDLMVILRLLLLGRFS